MTIEVQTPGPRLCLTAGLGSEAQILHNSQAEVEKQTVGKV